jgi:hypothetical protein
VVVAILESVMFRFMRLARAAPWAWMTYPVGALLGVGMLLAAMRKLAGGRTTWRGTTYRGERRDEPDAEVPTELTADAEKSAVDAA